MTTKQLITKNTTIGDAISQYPSIIEPLLDEGIHCIGCGASTYETLEEGLAGHGKTPGQIKQIIEKLNKAIPKEKGTTTLKITEPALVKLKEILTKKKAKGFRIKVVSGGCQGHSYAFDLVHKKENDDTIITIDKTDFFVDKESLELLKGAKIDYVDNIHGSGFRIVNPNANKSCGCGNSFS